MGYTNLDNVFGYKIPDWVYNQLMVRSKKNSQSSRDESNLAYLSNKTAWVRLVSSIDIKDEYIARIKKPKIEDAIAATITGTIPKTDASIVAKQYILFGGTSAYNGVKDSRPEYYLRRGAQTDGTGTYGMLGEEEVRKYGYRPMPGIKSVKVVTQGKLGSIRTAEIQFSVNDKMQLDLMDMLYFKLGYSMFLEWGNTYYYKVNNQDVSTNGVTSPETLNRVQLKKSEDLSIDPFEGGLDKDSIRYKIMKNVRESEGNYDAMLGIVTNFNFVSNVNGGYDCTLKLQALGYLGESIRINGVTNLPTSYKQAIKTLANALSNANEQNAIAKRRKDIQNKIIEASQSSYNYPECVKNLIENKTLTIQKVGNIYGATATSGDFAGYIFYYDKTYQYNNSKGVYKCDQVGNIVDGADKILGKQLYDRPKTYNEYLQIAFSDRDRYKIVELKSEDLTNYIISDTISKKSFYAFARFNTLIEISYGDAVVSDAAFKLSTEKLRAFIDFSKYKQFGLSESIDWKQELINALIYKLKPIEKISANLRSGFVFREGERTNESLKYTIDHTSGPDRTFKALKKIIIEVDGAFKRIPDVEYDKLFNIKDGDKITMGSIQIDSDWFPIIDKLGETLNAKGGRSYPVISLRSFSKDFVIKFYLKVELPLKIDRKVESFTGAPPTETKNALQGVDVTIRIEDLGLIDNIDYESSLIKKPIDNIVSPQVQSIQETATEELEYVKINADELAKSESSQYRSQIECILRTIQFNTLARYVTGEGGSEAKTSLQIDWTNKGDNTKFLKAIHENGAFSGMMDTFIDPNGSTKINGYITDGSYFKNTETKFNVESYYGFHRGLMKNPYEDTSREEMLKELSKCKIDYKSMFRSVVIPYYQSQDLFESANIHYPCYIPLSWFFFLVNHCCLLYEQSNSRSIFYLDFNTESNMCQSNDTMLCTDPYRFIVPFTGNVNSFSKLFQENVLSNEQIIGISGSANVPLWKEDSLSKLVPYFKKQEGNIGAYRGRFLNCLVSIDYLLRIIRSHSSKDETNAVYFKTMMEEIIADFCKYTGTYNYLRLAYDDDSNCFYVIDDQDTPSDGKILNTESHDLPLYGKESIATSLQISTDTSTRIGSVIGISANADVGSQTTNGIEATSFGNTSVYAIDRYKKNIAAISASNQTKKANDTEKEAAMTFNYAIDCFYRSAQSSEEMTGQATNYYIDRVLKAKNKDSGSMGTQILPLGLSFSTDGISGLGIMSGFTVDDELLPYSYTTILSPSQAVTRRVGFVVTGLDHTIEGNRWITSVKSNMYFLKSNADYKSKIDKQTESNFQVTAINQAIISNSLISLDYKTTFVSSNNQQSKNAKSVAQTYLGRELSEIEWNSLIAATAAESDSKNRQQQSAYIAAVILNRAKQNNSAVDTILKIKNQFQAVTGTSKNGRRPSETYIKGPTASIEDDIYSGIINYLSSIDKRYINFTSNLESAYKDGTDISYLYRIRQSQGAKVVGNTIFSY